ncbi:MAG TPA: hypothetical protein VFH85_00030 [Gammaproteobacteria bacterium]|nr:hypothetical protein [Gammaproteobacteria bacterium]
MPNFQQNLNIVWTIAAALPVYLMHAGFGFYEGGMCRKKNRVDLLSHNLMILAVAIIAFWLVGFGVLFGNGNAFMGLTGFAPELSKSSTRLFHSLAAKPVPLAVAFAFALSFCDTPATLIGGIGAERIKYSAVMAMTVLISAVIFPIVGHWAIGGGWLENLPTPFYDSGSGFIHLAGGCCALAVAAVLGPRRGRFEYGEDEAIAPGSMQMVFLGTFLLWMGFFGFNAGLAMKASALIGLIVQNIAIASGFSAVVAMGGTWLLTGKAGLRPTVAGLLCANVAITSPSGVVEPWAAAAIGIIAGLVSLGTIHLWAWLHIDDPVEYLTMNVVGGVLGLLGVGLFASPRIVHQFGATPMPHAGVFYGGGTAQLWSELIGAGAIATFALLAAGAACLGLKAAGLLRVDPWEEEEGADIATHGEKADQDESSGADDSSDANAREPEP